MEFYGDRPSSGIIYVRGDANAERDKAGAKAIADVAAGGEFTFIVPEDLQQCFDRLEEIRTEMGVLYNKLYATQAKPTNNYGDLGSPPYQVRVAIRTELDMLSTEEAYIQVRIDELKWALPVMDEDNDAEEDEDEKEDMTQPDQDDEGVGNAKTVGWPDHVASTEKTLPSVANKRMPNNAPTGKTRL